MTRMSGGVFDEYSAPKSHRVRSEKYQAKTRAFSPATRSAKSELGMGNTLVNVWPFFFRSGDYTSILWPMVDFDRYGMAIRPLYNHEGDDYSILFPLSAWNPADKSGWILNATWSSSSFNFFPLVRHSFDPANGELWYTPLLIHTWNYRKPWPFVKLKSEETTSFMLGYHSKRVEFDESGKEWLFRYQIRHQPEVFKRELAYRCAKAGLLTPVTDGEIKAFREAEYLKLPEKTATTYGFFPLFHAKEEKDAKSLIIVGPLFEWEKSEAKSSCWFLGPILGKYSSRELAPSAYGDRFGRTGESSFTSLALLSFFGKRTLFLPTPEKAAIDALVLLSLEEPFTRVLPEIREKLAILDPALKLPETVVDGNTFRLFLTDFIAERKLGEKAPVYHTYGGGFLPLFLYDVNRDSSWWFSLAALSGGQSAGKSSYFWSVPLLSYFSESPKGSVANVAAPLVWYASTKRADRVDKPIHSRDAMWTDTWKMAEFESEYAALGLYFHGKDFFYVACENVDAKAAERARQLFLKLSRERAEQQDIEEQLQKDDARNQAWKTKDKIEHYRKLIAEEELRIKREALAEKVRKTDAETRILSKLCDKLGFIFRPESLADRDAARAEVDKLFEHCAELRGVEDFGNGIFFRKRILHNGDYDWHTLFYLAGGEKKGTMENTHFLHFLYRYRQDGKRSEELIFPFISKQKDGEDSRVSFLWRVFERVEKNGKTGGHIFFIPYGDAE